MKKKSSRKKEIEKVFRESHVMLLLEDVREDIRVSFDGITGLTNKFNSFEIEAKANLKAIFEYLVRIEGEISDIKAEINKIKIGKIGWANLSNLEARVEKVEKENHLLRSILQKHGLLANTA